MISQSCVHSIVSAATTKRPKIQTHSGWAVKSSMFNRILLKETCTFSGTWNDFPFLSQMMKQAHSWGYGINSDTETDTKETDSKPAHVQ